MAQHPAHPVTTSSPGAGGIVNAMTVDVEDYFQVSAFDGVMSRQDWDRHESRVCRNTERLLEIFDDAGLQATFFVLGWIAERFPELVRRIHEAGHELASHSHEHRLVYAMHPDEFREDLRRARAAIETAAGVPIRGFRAPSYSVTRRSLWALDVLVEEGYAYDASVYPVHHDRYGIHDWPRHVHRVERPHGGLWEVPGSTVRWAGTNFPIGGGGYFRLLPYAWTRMGIAHVNRVEGRPAIFYLHPWELDPEQPRIPAPAISRFRHYRHLDQTEPRLRRLLGEFRFGPVRDVLATLTSGEVAAVGTDPETLRASNSRLMSSIKETSRV